MDVCSFPGASGIFTLREKLYNNDLPPHKLQMTNLKLIKVHFGEQIGLLGLLLARE